MSFLHCHNCCWSQDDWWTDAYNPIQMLSLYERELLLAPESLDAPKWGHHSRRRREVVLEALSAAASKVRGMKYRTREEFQKENPSRVCPQCGEQALDQD